MAIKKIFIPESHTYHAPRHVALIGVALFGLADLLQIHRVVSVGDRKGEDHQ